MSNAVADDIWIFKDGTYNVGESPSDYEEPTLDATNSGTSGHPIVFQSENPLGAIINGTPYGANVECVLFGANNREYITWDGFKATCSGGTYLSKIRSNATGTTIKNCEIVGAEHSTGGASNMSGIHLDGATNALIQNNYIHGFIETSGNGNTGGIRIFTGSGTVIERNTLENNTVNIDVKFGGSNETIRYNLLLPTDSRSGKPSLAVKSYAAANVNLLIYQNIIIGDAVASTVGIGLDMSERGGHSMTISNNTIYGGMEYGLVESGDNTNTWNIYNNIFYKTGTSKMIWWAYDRPPAYIDYNTYYISTGTPTWTAQAYGTPCTQTSLAAWQSTCLYDANSVSTDPGFIQAGGTVAEDYKRSSYTANGRGGAYPSVMGAYITGSEIIGYSSAIIPTLTGGSVVGGVIVQ